MAFSTKNLCGVSLWAGPLMIGAMAMTVAGLLSSSSATGSTPAGDAAKRVWDFQSDTPGAIAREFIVGSGGWEVATENGTKNRVLLQTAKNVGRVYNVALLEDSNLTDVDLSVRVKPFKGKEDQGGGVVWRARDAKNYYVVRYNPLEDNFRLYKVVDGERTEFGSADVPGDEKWHTVRATMHGRKIACYLDGKKTLEFEDATFPDAGKVGLWTKADAQSWFDDFTVAGE
jgi:hypothetical protein